MDREGGDDRRMQMLQRIVAMLFSLSQLACRSTNRSRIVRRAVCWILALALSPAKNLVAGVAYDLGLHADLSDLEFSGSADSVDDLMQLAEALAELARTLQTLVCLIDQLAPAERERALQTIAARIATFFRAYKPAFPRDLPGLGAPYPDTS